MSMRTILTCLIVCTFGLNACGPLQHVDDPSERGGDRPMPWHFHTGEGYSEQAFTDTESGETKIIRSRCNLSSPHCRERVYYFSHEEIMAFVNAAKAAYEQDLETHGAYFATSAAIATWSGKTAVAGLVAPDPTVVTSKLVAAGSAVIAGVAVLIAAWEGYSMAEILLTMSEINELVAAEERYVSRCGHLRRDFLPRLRELGVTIFFTAEGGTLIPGHHYQETVATDRAIMQGTYDRATEDEKIGYSAAYDAVANNACGHLPLVHGLPKLPRTLAEGLQDLREDEMGFWEWLFS